MAFQLFENFSFIYTPQNLIDGSWEKWSLQHDGPLERTAIFSVPKIPVFRAYIQFNAFWDVSPIVGCLHLLAPSLQLCERRRSTKKQNGQVPARSPCFLVKMQCQWFMRWGLWHKALWKFLCQTSEATEIISGGRHLWRDDTLDPYLCISKKWTLSCHSLIQESMKWLFKQFPAPKKQLIKKIIIIKVAKREKTCWSKMTVGSFQYEFSNNGKSKKRNYSQHQSGLQVLFSLPSAVAHFILV